MRIILLAPPVGYVWYAKCDANLHWVGVVIIEIWNNLPPLLSASGGEFKYSLAVLNKGGTRSLCSGVLSATLLGVEYLSSSLDKSYGSKDDRPDHVAIAEGMRLLLGTFSGTLTGKR